MHKGGTVVGAGAATQRLAEELNINDIYGLFD
jgi:hypothetical protein